MSSNWHPVGWHRLREIREGQMSEVIDVRNGSQPQAIEAAKLTVVDTAFLKPDTTLTRVADNILKPVINTALIEPHNALTSTTNDIARLCGASGAILNDWEPYQLPSAALCSKEWFAQNLSSGLAMAIPYGIAAVSTRGGLRFLGTRFGASTVAMQFLTHNTTSMILGATMYDGLRKPKDDETRIGNAVGGLVGFSIFEGGNHYFNSLTGSRLIVSRALTGIVGAGTQYTVSHFLATGKRPEGEHLVAAMLSGATMNVVLPRITDKITDVVNSGTSKLGLGVPLEDYITQLARNQSKDPRAAHTLATLLHESPFVRVQECTKGGDRRNGDLVYITPGDGVLSRLTHELEHTHLRKESETRFQRASDALRSNQQIARHLYMEARVLHELAARLAENRVASELGEAPRESLSAPDRIAMERLPDGSTYEMLWSAEFEKFVTSEGGFRPTQDFRPFKDNSPPAWKQREVELSSLSACEKIKIARNLNEAPQGQARAIWTKLLRDNHADVLCAVVDAISLLPLRQRLKAWFDAVSSTHPLVRRAAISRIGDLPACQRVSGWRHAISQPNILAPASLGELPAGFSHLSTDARTLLVVQIANLPSPSRAACWRQAFNDPRTNRAAVENLSVLPEHARSNCWHELYQSGAARLNTLARQIPDLAPAQRVKALREAAKSPAALEGEVARRALESIPEATGLAPTTRMAEWRLLLKGTTENTDKGVFSCIACLPESMRGSAWHEAFNSLVSDQVAQATAAIASLPAEATLAALERVICKAPSVDIVNQLRHVPPESIPALQRSIQSMESGTLRDSLALALPLWTMSKLPMQQRILLLQKVFGEAARHPEVFTASILRHWWWHLLPEEAVLDPTAPLSTAPVKKVLAELLPAEQLSTIIFPDSPELGQTLARVAPDAVRNVASRSGDYGPVFSPLLASVSEHWLQTRSLQSTIRHIMSSTEDIGGWDPVYDLVAALAKSEDTAAVPPIVSYLRETVLDPSITPERMERAVSLAAAVRIIDPLTFDHQFLRPIEESINAIGDNYMWKLDIARELARLSREGRLGDATIRFPDLRMGALKAIAPLQQAVLRAELEAALLRPDTTAALLGNGTLGQIFPAIFGEGSVRPSQSGLHELPVHDHRLRLLQQVRQHREFGELPVVDQTNLLLAALLLDSGSNPGVAAHGGWASARVAYGVLRTLGYPPERVQRIATLMSRHSQLSPFASSDILINPLAATDLALFYRHPEAIRQLAILNEADIRSTHCSLPWTMEVQFALDAISQRVRQQQVALNLSPFPILLSEIPTGFGLHTLGGDWRVLAHTSPFLNSSFFQQLGLIESPNYSVSTSLLTPRHRHLYARDATLVALFTGPPENISLSARSAFTGTNVNRARLLRQLSGAEFAENGNIFGRLSLAEVNATLARRWKGPRNVNELMLEISRFDNLDQVPPKSTLRRALDAVTASLTRDEAGRPLGHHNEVKMNNATLVGIGIIRQRWQSVVFERMNLSSVESGALLRGQPAPEWLKWSQASASVVIPHTVWQEAMSRNLRFVMLDGK